MDDATPPMAQELVPVRTVAIGRAIHIEDVPERGSGREGVVERGRGPMSFDAIVASHERHTSLLTVISRYGHGMVLAHYVTGVHPDSLVRVLPDGWDALSGVRGGPVTIELRRGDRIVLETPDGARVAACVREATRPGGDERALILTLGIEGIA